MGALTYDVPESLMVLGACAAGVFAVARSWREVRAGSEGLGDLGVASYLATSSYKKSILPLQCGTVRGMQHAS